MNKPQDIYKEACVETYAECVLAEQRGANRLELCSALEHGGLTPSIDLVNKVLANVNIPTKVMVRARKGNFVYNEAEIKEMEKSIDAFKEAGVHGVVFGFLTPDNRIDIETTKRLTQLAKPLNVCFHKAIDEVEDILEAVEQLCNIPGVDAILTSGGEATAMEGQETLRQMLKVADNRLQIVVAGKVLNSNMEELNILIKAKEYHGRRIVGELE
ncbi:copper homeostasis protein [Saccharicrinis carchari]|uniref:PF03932 family protein CutC n=1 Tax=Saccharicrinis carchari TaxID=1168039 RepID=A0A521ECX2_SACCC|nr:copper homeostasis protein CutC [Saccharicrinis carchari]SMO81301.1 copper homeostasis protein [Saccharicrinis carchari]